MGDVITSGIVSLDGAQKIVATVLENARGRELNIAVAVTGPAGDLRAFARMDGVSALAGETARRKCWTVIMTGRNTREFAERIGGYLEEEPGLFHGMIRIGDIAAFAGGFPIKANGQTVGAVGVSGSSSDDDNQLAEEGAGVIGANS